MRDWNVVAIVAQHRFKDAFDLLQPFGPVKRTRFYNTVVMKVADVPALLETLREWSEKYPDTSETLVRLAPAHDRFRFESAEEFQSKARDALFRHLPQLAGKRFFVRVHRRDRRARFSESEEERSLGAALFDELEKRGTPGRVDFADPDAILDVETVDDEAGVACWSRDKLQRYPFLKLH